MLRGWETDADDLGPTRVEGASAELAEVLDEVRTPSLLGDRPIRFPDVAGYRTLVADLRTFSRVGSP